MIIQFFKFNTRLLVDQILTHEHLWKNMTFGYKSILLYKYYIIEFILNFYRVKTHEGGPKRAIQSSFFYWNFIIFKYIFKTPSNYVKHNIFLHVQVHNTLF